MKNYLEKIDPYLYNMVGALNSDSLVNCVVYAKNYFKVKSMLKHNKNVDKGFHEYPFIKAFGIKLKFNKLSQVAKSQQIKYITANTKVFAQINIAKKITNISKLNQAGYYGEGITIAIIDTGIKPHLDFVCPTNRIIKFKDFVKDNKKAYDDNGHGTFVAGIACGSGFISNSRYSGVAPKANIISLKTLDENGETGAFSILEAMQWVYDNSNKYNIKVVCMSFGSNPLDSGDPLTLGAEALWQKGVIVVAAAGNSGPDSATIKSPGVSSKIITVGALDDKRNSSGLYKRSNFEVANFSSRGPALNKYKPDVLAPGVNIKSTSIKKGEFYTILSGTSVATPIVAGLACLLVEKYPKITPNEVKGLLVKHSYPIINDRNSEGFGLIDANTLFNS